MMHVLEFYELDRISSGEIWEHYQETPETSYS